MYHKDLIIPHEIIIIVCHSYVQRKFSLCFRCVDGQPPSMVGWFCQWLEDTMQDFRVQKSMLSGMWHAIFGLGNS